MSKPEPGSPAPAFKAPDQTGQTHKLSDYKGRHVILYFYPKDDTSGCTREACKFRDTLPSLKEAEGQVIGVSPDTVESHKHFAEKYNLPFPLLADPDHKIIRDYGVEKGDSAKRTTFLIGPDGKLVKVYNQVKPERHAEEVLADLQNLRAA